MVLSSHLDILQVAALLRLKQLPVRRNRLNCENVSGGALYDVTQVNDVRLTSNFDSEVFLAAQIIVIQPDES